MRAFMIAMVAMLVITVGAAAGLRLIPSSASDVYTERSNVRL